MGRPSKTVSDALRWEVRKRRVVRAGRARYAAGTMPRSMAWWMRDWVRRRALDAGRWKATKTSVRDALLDGWLACAPAPLARAHLERAPRRR